MKNIIKFAKKIIKSECHTEKNLFIWENFLIKWSYKVLKFFKLKFSIERSICQLDGNTENRRLFFSNHMMRALLCFYNGSLQSAVVLAIILVISIFQLTCESPKKSAIKHIMYTSFSCEFPSLKCDFHQFR